MDFSLCPALKGSLSDHTIPVWFWLEGTLKILSSQALPWAGTLFTVPACCTQCQGLPILRGDNPLPPSSLNPQKNFCSTRTSHLTPPAWRTRGVPSLIKWLISVLTFINCFSKGGRGF
uniref:Uncharacterized protein n=1 Tax=Cyanoderma ruficeps TaxID=181631 RepID=A0A8C3QYR4_9PASS